MFVGIDFGTSNSSIGVFHNDQLRLFDLDPRHPETPGTLFR
jgi:molecular chaperone DnaK (HSP70)